MEYWLVFLIISCVTGLSQGACDSYVLSPGQPAGVLVQSPNYPDKYSNNEDTCWIFSVPHGRIKFMLYEAHTEYEHDRLNIYDGTSKADTLLRSISGYTEAPGLVVTSGRDMLVRFSSDLSQTFKGFQACVCPQTDESFCRCDDITFVDPERENNEDGSSGRGRHDGRSGRRGKHGGRDGHDGHQGHDDHDVAHDDEDDDYEYDLYIRHLKKPLVIVAITVGIIIVICLVVGVPIQVCGCKCAKSTQHPSAYEERRRRGELPTSRRPGTEPGIAVTYKDGLLLSDLSTPVVRPWMVPAGPQQPPVYTALSLPPLYTTPTSASPDEMVISAIKLPYSRLPPLSPHRGPPDTAALPKSGAEPETAAVPVPVATPDAGTASPATATADEPKVVCQ